MEYLNLENPLMQSVIVGAVVYGALMKLKPEMFFKADGMPKMGIKNPMVVAGAAAGLYYYAMGMESAAQVLIGGSGDLKDLNSLLPPESFYNM